MYTVKFLRYCSVVSLLVLVIDAAQRVKFYPETGDNICVESICEFELVIEEELSLVYRIEPGVSVGIPQGELQYVDIDPTTGELKFNRTKYYSDEIFSVYDDIDIAAEDVITLNGERRTIFTTNQKFPGPNIEVMRGAEVVVKVDNRLLHREVTMHWHGLHLYNTPWMDGTAHVTQCPIPPGSTFTYRFLAEPAGSMFYHDHLHGQFTDGLYGHLIIHEHIPDTNYFPTTIQHWVPTLFEELNSQNPHRLPYNGQYAGPGENILSSGDALRSADGVKLTAMVFHSILINSRGQVDGNEAPISTFEVETGSRYTFRILNPGLEFTLVFSVDEHRLTIDGADHLSSVDRVTIAPGQRCDMTLEASLSVSNYWIRVRTVDDGGEQKAILHYDGADEIDPSTSDVDCTTDDPCRVYNPAWSVFPEATNTVAVLPNSTILSDYTTEVVEKIQDVDFEIFLDVGFAFGSGINGRGFVPTDSHMYTDDPSSGIVPCDDEQCADSGCFCTHIVDIPFGKSVQIVLTNIGDSTLGQAHHSMHIHGYTFAVLKTGFAQYNETSGEITENTADIVCNHTACLDSHWAQGHPTGLNLVDPVFSDTIVVPFGGYTVLRIFSDNPGYWLLHCHQTLHLVEGMQLILNVSGDQAPRPPDNFPQCSSYEFTQGDFDAYISGSFPSSKEKKDVSEKKKTYVVAVIFFAVGIVITPLVMLVFIALKDYRTRVVRRARRKQRRPHFTHVNVMKSNANLYGTQVQVN